MSLKLDFGFQFQRFIFNLESNLFVDTYVSSTKLMKYFYLILTLSLVVSSYGQQYQFDLVDSVPVNEGAGNLSYPWASGINSGQFSTIELNGDFLDDIFVFDRTDNKILTFINQGTIGNPDYVHAPEYQKLFPTDIRSWCLLRDYNCDGKKDIWAYSTGGIKIYRNIGTSGNVEFDLTTNLVMSMYNTTLLNLYVSSTDIPSIDDIDGDGDLDVVTFSIFGANVEYHRNYSIENFGTCDSLDFRLMNNCWGHFTESFTNNALLLYDTCDNSNLGVPAEFIDNGLIRADLIEQKGGAAHSGSTVLTLDENGDGVKDILIGDISYRNMPMLNNSSAGVNLNTSMTSQDTTFPSYDTPISIQIFPAAYYEDVTNDGNRDLIVCPNTINQSEDIRSVHYYINNGTDSNPDFIFQQSDLLQDEMIDVGTGSTPTLFDHNSDGLLDLLVSNFGAYDLTADEYLPSVSLYENTGTATSPIFTLITTDYMGLSTSGIEKNMMPAFGDLDGDGDDDMIIGDYDGVLHYFTNTAGAGNTANFVLLIPQMTDVDAITIDVGLHAAPELIDLDNDGDLDIVIGERNGNLNYFENNSTSSPSFSKVTDSLGFVRVQYLGTSIGMSVPRFFQNTAGETQLFVGSEHGSIEHFNNIDGNLTGSFDLYDDQVSSQVFGLRSTPALGDLDGDGFPDLIVGNKRGGLQIAIGDPTFTSIAEIPNPISFVLYPNPAENSLTVSLKEQTGTTIELLNANGQLLYSDQISNLTYQLDVSQLSSGMYFIKLVGDGNVSAQRFIKK